MNVEIGAEAAQFSEKEYINGIAVAACAWEIVFISGEKVTFQPLFRNIGTGATSPKQTKRKDLFHMYSLSPHLPSVSTSQQGPCLSGLSGYKNQEKWLEQLNRQRLT